MNKLFFAALVFLFGLAVLPLAAEERPDILIADFEGEDYGPWVAEGLAFGPGPALGTLPNQMTVEGFRGERLVNSFHGGDDSTGRLTSPPLRIDRRYLNFLIGGGRYPGETCLNLVVDGQVVRTATGPNDRPGGSERLDWATWDVSEWTGREALLEIVDSRRGGWGHINVDQIVQSDRPAGLLPSRRLVQVTDRYLHLPIQRGEPRRRMTLSLGGDTLREFEIELARDRVDDWVAADLDGHAGKRLTIAVDGIAADAIGLDQAHFAPHFPGAEVPYSEPLRPRFHFTSRRGWLNDPNGLVYANGVYHLFYQHNPYGWDWGNMHWGHATSTDLVHWREQPIALYPRAFGDWAFSGSAVVDERNTSGFGTDGRPPLVLAYTSTGRGECIAFSNDDGRTWTEYERNPVVTHDGRDPRLLRHTRTHHWVMALYDRHEGVDTIAFYTSPDLKAWTFASRIPGFFECPDLFEIAVAGDSGRTRWVLYGADGRYLLGDFDGSAFHPDGEKHQLWFGDFYAAQTFSDAPDGRRIQIGWGRGITFPGMPFNQQMTVPVDLSLHDHDGTLALHAEPVPELKTLRREPRSLEPIELGAMRSVLTRVEDRSFDLEVVLEPGSAQVVGLDVLGTEITYDVERKALQSRDLDAPLDLAGKPLDLRILVDRGSIEVFAADGRIAFSIGGVPPEGRDEIALFARGGSARMVSGRMHRMASSWEP